MNVKQKHLRVATTVLVVLIALGVGGAAGQQQSPPEYGPAKGTLVIVGGGSTQNAGITEKFIELAGGTNAKYVIVPTAAGNKGPDGKVRLYSEEEVVAPWKRMGLKNVRMLHPSVST